MMKLSTMNDVVETVNDEWESALADQIVQRWDHDEPVKYWRASSNFIFFFKNLGVTYVLRFNHARERMPESIQAEIEFVNALAEEGIRVAKPIRSIAGNFVESVDVTVGEIGHGLFHAAAFEAMPGEQLDLDELTTEQFVLWGKALGELHNAAALSPKAARPTWTDQLAMAAEILPSEDGIAHQAIDRLSTELSQLAVDEQNFGLIHFDFELDNILWAGAVPGLIDFDDCAYHWFAADIAFATRDLFDDCASKVDMTHNSFLHFIQGYRTARPIEQAELERIPLFMQVHNLMMLARLHRTLTPVNPTGELPWMADLREKLAAKMDFYRVEIGG